MSKNAVWMTSPDFPVGEGEKRFFFFFKGINTENPPRGHRNMFWFVSTIDQGDVDSSSHIVLDATHYSIRKRG